MPDEPQGSSSSNFGTVTRLIELLEPLSVEDREHVLRTIATWFRIEIGPNISSAAVSHRPVAIPQTSQAADEKFSNRPVQSVKDFVFEKEPRTEPERMACLAFYLTHFREMPHFKNTDLVQLNAEAAQRTFSNPGVAANNAGRDGYFVSAPKAGFKQLSAMGERFVHALPNREAAEQIRQRMKRGRRTSTKDQSNEQESNGQEPAA